MSATHLDTSQLAEVRSFFVEDGVSVAQWARVHNFSRPLVYAVLKGRNQATRGGGEATKLLWHLGLSRQEIGSRRWVSDRLQSRTVSNAKTDNINFGKELHYE